MPTIWDRQTWEEGYQKGYIEGHEAGRHCGEQRVYCDLLMDLYTWGIDQQLNLHGDLSPAQVLHEVVLRVEHLRATSMLPSRGDRHACGISNAGRLAYAG